MLLPHDTRSLWPPCHDVLRGVGGPVLPLAGHRHEGGGGPDAQEGE